MKQANTRKLAGSVGVESIADLHEEACDSRHDDRGLEFDLENVESIDTSAIQLFLAAEKAYATLEQRFTVSNSPDRIIEAFAACGAKSTLLVGDNSN